MSTESTQQAKISFAEKKNQLIDPSKFKPERLVFADPSEGEVPGEGPAKIKFKRINLAYRNSDGSLSDVIFCTERLFSYGVAENHDMASNALNGYQMPLVLYSRDGATSKEMAFVKALETVADSCRKHLLKKEIKSALKKHDLEASDLRKILNCFYVKKDEEGNPLQGSSPTLYVKLITSSGKKKGKKGDTEEKKGLEKPKIVTQFFDEKTGVAIDPLSLMGKYCYTRSAVKVESIFVGSKITLQVKMYECCASLLESSMKSLLPRNNPGTLLSSSFQGEDNEDEKEEEKEEEEKPKGDDEKEGSLKGSDDEQEETPKKAKKSPVKKSPTKKTEVKEEQKEEKKTAKRTIVKTSTATKAKPKA